MPFESLLTKEMLGLAAMTIGFISAAYYNLSIVRGQTRPHMFTHIIWTIVCAVALGGQIHDGAGAGAWPMWISTLSCLLTVCLSPRFGEKTFTRSDKIALAAALLAIIPWILTKDPLISVILVSIIDLFAFYPTFRKSWHKPYQENLLSFYGANVKNILAVCALEHYTLNTLLFLVTVLASNTVFIIMCHIRRLHYETAAPVK